MFRERRQSLPELCQAWALLSQTYIDEIRFRYPIDPSSSPASLDRARAAARRAVELDSQNVRALQAEMFVLYFSGQPDAGLKLGEQALAMNPNDTELIREYGSRLAVSGRWDRGCELVAEARDRNPEAPKPAVPIKKSLTPDHIICLEDGKTFKSLKRHLRTRYDMSPQQYREKWGLSSDYPMVAPKYAENRSNLAKQMGLGQGRKRPAAPVVAEPVRKPRGRKAPAAA